VPPATQDELGDGDVWQACELDDLLLTDGHSELRRVDRLAEEKEQARIVAR